MNRISLLLASAAFVLLAPAAFAAQVEIHQGANGQQIHINAPTEDDDTREVNIGQSEDGQSVDVSTADDSSDDSSDDHGNDSAGSDDSGSSDDAGSDDSSDSNDDGGSDDSGAIAFSARMPFQLGLLTAFRNAAKSASLDSAAVLIMPAIVCEVVAGESLK